MLFLVKPGPKGEADDLLRIWKQPVKEGQEKIEACEELQFNEIVQRADVELNIKKRTVINYLKVLIEKKAIIKRVDDQRRTFYKPIDMKSLVNARLNEDFEELNKFTAINQLDLELVDNKGRPYGMFGSHHTARINEPNRELVEKWETKISKDFKEYLSRKHPEYDKQSLETETLIFKRLLFNFLEGNSQLNILTSLDIPSVDASKYKTSKLSVNAKIEGLYAKIWDNFFEILLLLLMKNYEQYGSFKEFLKKSENSKLVLLFEANTDFSLIVEYQEEVLMKPPPPRGFHPIFSEWVSKRQIERLTKNRE